MKPLNPNLNTGKTGKSNKLRVHNQNQNTLHLRVQVQRVMTISTSPVLVKDFIRMCVDTFSSAMITAPITVCHRTPSSNLNAGATSLCLKVLSDYCFHRSKCFLISSVSNLTVTIFCMPVNTNTWDYLETNRTLDQNESHY